MKRSHIVDLFGAANEKKPKTEMMENTENGIRLAKVEDIVGFSLGTRVFLPRAELVCALGNLYVRGEETEFLLKCEGLLDREGGEDSFPLFAAIKNARVINGNGLEVDAEGVDVLVD